MMHLITAALITCGSSQVETGYSNHSSGWSDYDTIGAIGLLGLTSATASNVSAIGTIAAMSDGTSAHTAWEVGGYVSGGLSVVSGVMALSHRDDEFSAWGAYFLGSGLVSITTSVVSNLLPDQVTAHGTVYPVLMETPDGAPAGGLGFSGRF